MEFVCMTTSLDASVSALLMRYLWRCKRLAVSPLKKLQCKDNIIEDITEESEVEETYVNTSFHFSQEDTTAE